ncbi:MAG TPA: hypothetical protein VJ596_08970 [Gemmatimonadaceae bacterium]|nr:hypothetical protein [Gemmatimonadaceae bacterium]
MSAPPRPEDFKPGILGLLVALVFLGIVAFTVVKLTNAKFAGHGAPAAEATH